MSFNDLERGTGSSNNNSGSSNRAPGRSGRSTGGPLPLYHAPRSSSSSYDDEDAVPVPPPHVMAEFKKLSDTIATQIFKITSNTQGINKLVKLADAKGHATTKQPQERDWIKGAHDLVESTRAVIKSTTPTLKQLSQLVLAQQPQSYPQHKLHLAKLQRDFESALQAFSEAQKQSARKSKEELDGAKRVVEQGQRQQQKQQQQQQLVPLDEAESSAAAAAASGSVDEGPLSQQTQIQQQQQKRAGPSLAELEFQESLIAERETSIREIESGIHELNEIFRDLGAIVQEQGGMIDNIEYNINEIATNTEGADRELVQASDYQRKAGRRAACLMLIVGFVIAIVLLAILS